MPWTTLLLTGCFHEERKKNPVVCSMYHLTSFCILSSNLKTMPWTTHRLHKNQKTEIKSRILIFWAIGTSFSSFVCLFLIGFFREHVSWAGQKSKIKHLPLFKLCNHFSWNPIKKVWEKYACTISFEFFWEHDRNSLHTMAIRVVEFSNWGYKIRKIFA